MNQALMHWNTIMRLFDKLQSAGLEHHQAVLYDSLCRERWQQRLEDKDPAFKFDDVVVNTDKELWSVAEQRLPEVLKAAGITPAYPVTMGTTMVYSPPSGALAGGGNPYKAQKEEAEAATRKAEAAEHRMKAAQRIYDEKKQSLLSSSEAGHTGLSRRQEKNLLWTSQREANSRGGGEYRQGGRRHRSRSRSYRRSLSRGRGNHSRSKGGKGGKGKGGKDRGRR